MALVGYFALAAAMVVNQRAYIYFPPREYLATPARARLPFEALTLVAADGVHLRAWWVPAPRDAGPVLLYLHGNASNLSDFVDIAAGCHHAGMAFLAVDYRGYGESEGRPTEAGLYRDARAAYDWLAARGAGSRTVVYGQSLGTAVASWLAGEVPVAGLVLEAALPSTYRMARWHYPWLLVPEFLVRDRFPTVEHLARVACPVLVIHGEDDVIAPIEFGRMVFGAAREPRQFLPVPRTGHNDLRWNDPMIQGTILAFITRCMPARGRAAG